jgi:hypothetical protein
MRSKILTVLLLALGTVCVAHAQSSPSSGIGQTYPVIDAYFLSNEVYFLTNGRVNAIAFVTAEGIVLLDAMHAGSSRAVLDKLQQLTDMPVTDHQHSCAR